MLNKFVALQKGRAVDQDLSPLRSNLIGEDFVREILLNHVKRDVVLLPIVENKLSRIIFMVTQYFMRIKLGAKPTDHDLWVFFSKGFRYDDTA